MAKKKDYNNTEFEPTYESQEDNELEGEEGDAWFPYDVSAYMPVYNKKRKAYDMLVVRINSETDESQVEREETRYDSIQRALLDVKTRVEQELTIKKKKVK
jgi:hypothetical protein